MVIRKRGRPKVDKKTMILIYLTGKEKKDKITKTNIEYDLKLRRIDNDLRILEGIDIREKNKEKKVTTIGEKHYSYVAVGNKGKGYTQYYYLKDDWETFEKILIKLMGLFDFPIFLGRIYFVHCFKKHEKRIDNIVNERQKVEEWAMHLIKKVAVEKKINIKKLKIQMGIAEMIKDNYIGGLERLKKTTSK